MHIAYTPEMSDPSKGEDPSGSTVAPAAGRMSSTVTAALETVPSSVVRQHDTPRGTDAGRSLPGAWIVDVVEHAADDVLRGLRARGVSELFDRYRTVPVPPGREDAEQALRTLVDFSATRDREGYDRVVDALGEAPALDENQLYQAQEHAARKRWLIDHERLLSTEELVRLMPDRVPAGGNASRTLQGLRDRDELLGVRLMRDWRYPACQLDARGEIHAALKPALAEARRQGYTPWEMLFWLAAPGAPAWVPIVAGRPLEPAGELETLEEIARRAVVLHEDDPAAPELVRPASLLAAGETEAFRRLAARWLGERALTTSSG